MVARVGPILLFSEDPVVSVEGPETYFGYDEVARGYTSWLWPPEVVGKVERGYGAALVEVIGQPGIVMDLGCGPGGYLLHLCAAGHRVVAVDISLKMLTILAGRLSAVERGWILPCRMNAYDLPVLDESVDVVSAFQFLHFVGDPAKVLSEAVRTLRQGGLFVSDGPSESRTEGEDLNARVNRYYREALEEMGVGTPKPPGWSARQTRENLAAFFPEHRLVESEDLVFRFTAGPSWFLERLSARYTLFQMGLDGESHARALQRTRERMAAEYGHDFEKVKQDYYVRHRLMVCRK